METGKKTVTILKGLSEDTVCTLLTRSITAGLTVDEYLKELLSIAGIIETLKRSAEEQGVTFEALLQTLLDRVDGTDEEAFYNTVTIERWLTAYDKWVGETAAALQTRSDAPLMM